MTPSIMGCALSLSQVIDYSGGRTLDDLIEFVEEQAEGGGEEEEEEEGEEGGEGEGEGGEEVTEEGEDAARKDEL